MKTTIFIIIAIIAGTYFIQNYQRTQTWTLMVCESKMENGKECFENSYEIPGFKSARECLLEGASRFEKQGFECGRNCRKEYAGINVCTEVCNKSGCHE